MKKVILLTLLFTSISVFSQSNEKKTTDIMSIKAGLIGGWFSYEKSISDKFTLNGEIGYEGGFFKGNNNVNYAFTTVLNIESRYYYNLNKRIKNNKNTSNNAANYLSGSLFLVPNWFTSSDNDNLSINKSFGIITKYGIKRNISNNLSFEFAFGIGYSWGENNNNGFIPAFDLNIGFSL